MLRALADSVATEIKEKHQFQARLEGLAHEGWVLADCGDVIVHLLSPQRRDYYRLEELWSKGKILLRLQ